MVEHVPMLEITEDFQFLVNNMNLLNNIRFGLVKLLQIGNHVQIGAFNGKSFQLFFIGASIK